VTKPIESYWDLLGPHFEEINIYKDQATLTASIAEVPRHIVLLYAAHMCQSEVHNGGFLQLFWNSTGIIVPFGIEAYKTIGMPTLASLLEQAAQPLGSPYPLDRDERWDALVQASTLSEADLESLFKTETNLYVAFVKATENLPFDNLDRQFWDAAKTENGGFETAATRYAQGPFLLQ
jgi:hypothetical protein